MNSRAGWAGQHLAQGGRALGGERRPGRVVGPTGHQHGAGTGRERARSPAGGRSGIVHGRHRHPAATERGHQVEEIRPARVLDRNRVARTEVGDQQPFDGVQAAPRSPSPHPPVRRRRDSRSRAASTSSGSTPATAVVDRRPPRRTPGRPGGVRAGAAARESGWPTERSSAPGGVGEPQFGAAGGDRWLGPDPVVPWHRRSPPRHAGAAPGTPWPPCPGADGGLGRRGPGPAGSAAPAGNSPNRTPVSILAKISAAVVPLI